MTDIFDAIRANDTGMLRRILAENPDAIHEPYRENSSWSPIHFAANCDADMDIFDILLENKADINAQQKHWGINVLETIIATSPLKKIIHFQSLGAKISPESYVIWNAAWNPDADVIRYFLDQGEPFDVTYGFFDFTPVFIASCNPNAEILQILIDHGANLAGVTCRGLKVIHHAAQNGRNPECIKILLKNGFSVEEPDRFGQTPLQHAAADNLNVEILKVLLEMGADPLKMNSLGATPLKLANTKEKKEILRLAEWVAKGNAPEKLPKKKRRPLPKPRTAPKPLKLERVELVNLIENINECPIPEKARFFKDCSPDLLCYTNPDLTPDLSNSYSLVYFDLTDHDLVTLVDYLEGLESASWLILVLHKMKRMEISGGMDELFLCCINLEENADSFANLVNLEAEGEGPICIGNTDELSLSEFEPCQLVDRKTALNVAQYYAQKGKPDPKFDWDYDT